MDMEDRIEIERRLVHLEDQVDKIPAMSEKLDTMLTKFDRYEARWGLITIVLSSLGAIGLAFKDEFLSLIFHKPKG